MKKLISLMLCLAMALAWLPAGSPFAAAASSPFDGGSGTAEDPYLVSTPWQLEAVENYSGSHFLQTADIDLSGAYLVSMPARLAGIYDGGGHSIAGLTTALFGVNSGTIRNLTLINPYVYAGSIRWGKSNDLYYGILTNSNTGKIENCHVKAGSIEIQTYDIDLVDKPSQTRHLSVGALAGVNAGTISNCCVTKDEASSSDLIEAYCSGATYVGVRVTVISGAGGIAGWNQAGGTIRNCYSDLPVTSGSTYDYVEKNPGLLCGFNEGAVTGCYYGDAEVTGGDGVSSITGGGEGTADAEQREAGQELADQLNTAGGEPYWGLDGSGRIQMNARSLGVSAGLPSGIYDMGLAEAPVEVSAALDEAVEGAQISYTVLGQSSGKQPYTSPIRLTGDTELLLWGQLDENVYRVSHYSYQDLRYPVRADQPAGTYDAPIQVALSCAEPEAQIYYTTDGTDPTTSSSRYSYASKIGILGTTTVRAVAQVDGTYGDVLTYEYVISPGVTASPAGGSFEQPIEVTLEAREGYELWYTLDGSDPTQGTGIQYEGPVTICRTTDLKVAARRDGGWGEVTTFSYQYPPVTVTATPDGGELDDGVQVSLACSADYAQLSYKLDGGEEQPYDGPVGVVNSTQLTVYARYDGQLMAEETFSYTLPVFEIQVTPKYGSYQGIQTIELSCNREEAELYYALDDPSPYENGTLYTGPFELDRSATLWVAARLWGKSLAVNSYRYTLELPKVTTNWAPGDWSAPLEVTLTTEPGYRILYTLDGSDPKTHGIEYTEPIRIEEPVTTVIRAVPQSIDFDDEYGTTSEFRYTFSKQKVEFYQMELAKRWDYEATFWINDTLPMPMDVTFYAAAYSSEGRMLSVGSCQKQLEAKAGYVETTITVPGELPDDAVIKVFCVDSETKAPLCEPISAPVRSAEIIYALDSISLSPSAIVGEVGGTRDWPVITAHYINGKADRTISPSSMTWYYDNSKILVSNTADGAKISFKSPGTTTVEFRYTEAGVTRSATLDVTVVESMTDTVGFLADPTADIVPSGAIPISTAEELAAIDSAESAGKIYYLTRDIQLTGEWEPIYGFQGTLDGRGHTVSGLYISQTTGEPLAGLFASAYDAVIKNLAVEIDERGITACDPYSTTSGDVYAGGLVGSSQRTDYINCYVTGGRITASGDGPYAGGLVGYLMNQPDNRVVNCFSTCDVKISSTKATNGNVCMAGGLIGQLASLNVDELTELSRCYATGAVRADYLMRGTTRQIGHTAGGLVGTATRVKISDCFAQGDVVTSNSSGGVFPMAVGGLVGDGTESLFYWSYAAGNVTATAPGNLSYDGTAYVGGLYALPISGSADLNCYRVSQTVDGNDFYTNAEYTYAGTQLNSNQAESQSSYSGFDFGTTWTFTKGMFGNLPHLQYQG